jgi:hypothetical protein
MHEKFNVTRQTKVKSEKGKKQRKKKERKTQS